MSVVDLILGKPLPTSDERAQQIGTSAGIPIFGLDALSSAAYGPEAALTLLIPLGAAGVAYIVIALGLGVVGSMFVRSITIYLVEQEALDRYAYLEHGAHWAIGALSVIMLLSIEPHLEIPEALTASVGVFFVGAALTWSVLRNRRIANAA